MHVCIYEVIPVERTTVKSCVKETLFDTLFPEVVTELRTQPTSSMVYEFLSELFPFPTELLRHNLFSSSFFHCNILRIFIISVPFFFFFLFFQPDVFHAWCLTSVSAYASLRIPFLFLSLLHLTRIKE